MSTGTEPCRQWIETLYRERAGEIILYGRALGLSHAESEDVLQETFIALMQLAKTPDEPRFYCLRAFRNRALNHKRGLFRRLARELESQQWFTGESAESPQEYAAMRCLATLPREQREVIVLKIWHQHTFEEVSRLLDVSPHTAAGRYRYGMNKLRACLEETSHEHADRTESTGEPFAFLETAPAIRQP